MATIVYELNGPTQFIFPHAVLYASEVVLQVQPGTTVPTSEYEVIGAGPESQSVTIQWPQAPFDGTKELLITREVDKDRVADFTLGGIFPEALDAEFEHVYDLIGGGGGAQVVKFLGSTTFGQTVKVLAPSRVNPVPSPPASIGHIEITV